MKRIGKLFIWTIWALNALFAGLLLLTAFSPYISPVRHPMLSCAGLAFPAFLLIDVGFLCFWLLIRHYKCALLPLLGMLVCVAQIRTYLPLNFRTNESDLPENCIKLLSYNIRSFNGLKVKEEGKFILNYLKESHADIICLQEYNTIDWPQQIRQADVDSALKEYPYSGIHAFGTCNKMACFSKFPILSARLLDYPTENNGSVLYEIKIGADTVTLINNHLESNKLTEADKTMYADILKGAEKEKVKGGARLLMRKLAEASAIRAPQADTVAREIAASPHPYIIVCGDFNDSPISYAHRTVSRNMNDAFTQSGRGLGISYNQNRFYFRLDHILTSKNLKTYHCTVDRSIKVSDHYPIWCFIKKSTSERGIR